MGWLDRFGTARFDEAELAHVHSVSKQLIEEIVHVQRGYLPEEIVHVRRELDTLIDTIARMRCAAEHARRASQKIGVTDYAAHLNELAGALESDSVSRIREPLDKLRMFTVHLHDELHASIMRAYRAAKMRRTDHRIISDGLDRLCRRGTDELDRLRAFLTAPHNRKRSANNQ